MKIHTVSPNSYPPSPSPGTRAPRLTSRAGLWLLYGIAIQVAACTTYHALPRDGGVGGSSGSAGGVQSGGAGGSAPTDGGAGADGAPAEVGGDASRTCRSAGDCAICEICSPGNQCVPALNQDDQVQGRCAGTCDGAGACKSKKGQTCATAAGGCVGGTVCSVDGYCCDSACNGSCVACDIPGKQGTCTALGMNGAAHPGHAACAGAGTVCAGSCDGAGSCSYPTPVCTTSTTCSSNNVVDPNVCSNGACVAPPGRACTGNFICSGTACKTSCATSADCLPNYFCGAGACHLDATAIAAGTSHVCALLLDGTVRCWGGNSSGQLGNNAVATSTVPIQVNATGGAVLTGVTAIAAGGSHSCALLSDGTLRCWGDNTFGQLGNVSVISATSTTPVTVSASGTAVGGATAITASGAGACALFSDGTIKCWGANDSGQLGNPGFSGASSATPLAVTGVSGATRIVAGSGGHHTCALLSNGSARCWGNDTDGELGDGMMTSTSTAAVVQSGLGGISSMAAGLYHTCAVISGQIRCWGANGNAQLGNPGITAVRSLTPVTVGTFSNATAVAAALLHTCALVPPGLVYCWGANFNGELGSTTVTSSSSASPVYVSGLSGVTALTGGSYHTCALLPDGSVTCWGENGDGRLGNGSVANSTMPVPVTGW